MDLAIITLVISVLLNIVLVWYSIKLSRKYLNVTENIDDLIKVIANFDEHLTSIYEMEMFYGDETLKHLMEHCGSLKDVLSEYDTVEGVLLPLEDIDIEGSDEETKNQKVVEKDVLYAGTRRRDS